MTEREKWIKRFEEELLMGSDHVYDQRFLAISRDIVYKIGANPNYQPPTFEEVMKDAPWGP
ncbi:MAG: hypothetical protein Q7S43_03050 [bacterium]|nr:hypothetical protein [bacterium]MDO8496406.1 hypothetical protein [bacterium]